MYHHRIEIFKEVREWCDRLFALILQLRFCFSSGICLRTIIRASLRFRYRIFDVLVGLSRQPQPLSLWPSRPLQPPRQNATRSASDAEQSSSVRIWNSGASPNEAVKLGRPDSTGYILGNAAAPELAFSPFLLGPVVPPPSLFDVEGDVDDFFVLELELFPGLFGDGHLKTSLRIPPVLLLNLDRLVALFGHRGGRRSWDNIYVGCGCIISGDPERS